MVQDPSCLFCKIVERKIPSTVVYETDDALAFRDIHPQAPVHIVIVPKKHIPTITDVTLPDLHLINALFVAGNRIVEEEQIRDKGFRLVMNCRRDGGQTVDHLHLHLLGGRQMHWPPG